MVLDSQQEIRGFLEIFPMKVVADMPTQVNLVWRDFPLSFHEPMASKEASAAICAALFNPNAIPNFTSSIFGDCSVI